MSLLLFLLSFNVGAGAVVSSIQNHTLLSQTPSMQGESPAPTLKNEIRLLTQTNKVQFNLNLSQALDFTAQKPSQFNFEKGSIETKFNSLQIKVGDFHESLSNGLVLSLFEDSVLGMDNTLLGAKLQLQNETFPIRIMGGKIHSLNQPINLYPLSNPLEGRDVYLGTGEAQYQTNDLLLGVSLLTAQETQVTNTSLKKNSNAIGGHLEWNEILPSLSLSYSNQLVASSLTSPSLRYQLPVGQLHYFSLGYAVPELKVQLEGKWYKGETFDFVKPPSLEEEVVVTGLEDAKGLRLKAEKNFGSFQLGGSYLIEQLGTYSPRLINHPVLSLETKFTKVKLGVRNDSQNPLYHGTFYQKVVWEPKNYWELNLKKLFNPQQDQNSVEISYTIGNWVSFAVGYDYLPLEEASDRHKTHVGIKYQAQGFTLKGLVGSLTGGTQCSSGVCRVVPKFDGVFLESFITL